MNLNFEFVDNSAEIIAALHDTCERALWRCGEKAEEYAKDLCPVDTGNLRNSITHAEHAEAGGGEMFVGTDVNYAVYQEMGTGVYAEKSSPTRGARVETAMNVLNPRHEGEWVCYEVASREI